MIGNHYLHPTCSTKWTTAHNSVNPAPKTGHCLTQVRTGRFPPFHVLVPHCSTYMATLLRCLGKQRSKLKGHRGDSLDRRPFCKERRLANGVTPISDGRRSWKDVIYMTPSRCSLMYKENVESLAVVWLNHPRRSCATTSGEEYLILLPSNYEKDKRQKCHGRFLRAGSFSLGRSGICIVRTFSSTVQFGTVLFCRTPVPVVTLYYGMQTTTTIPT